ncbi:transcription factor A, mitochondrial-like [Arapaima gigas]
MLTFSLVSAGANLLVKSLGFLQSVSVLRRPFIAAIPAARHFGSSMDGPPKKPKTSYMHFAEQQWPIALREHPGVKVVDLSRKIGQKWREMTPEQKRPFVEASVAAREQYNAEMEQYKAQLTPAQSAALKEERREKMAKRKASRKRKELKNLGKPKRPRTALIIFIADSFAETKGATMIAKTKTLMEVWKNLSDSEKQVYIQQAEDDKVRYKNEIKSWEEHMREIGREDLVRRTVIKVKKTASVKRGKKKSRVRTIKTKGTVKSAAGKESTATEVSKTTRKATKAEE